MKILNDKFLLFLSLARKSGNTFLGMDSVKDNILKKNVVLVLVASDISENSFEKINYICGKNEIKILKVKYNMEEMSSFVGKETGIIGIKDKNFAKKIISMVEVNLDL